MHREVSIFFFQAEDGIRDGHVTGVQTCALPISVMLEGDRRPRALLGLPRTPAHGGGRRGGRGAERRRVRPAPTEDLQRSEERRVGKECKTRWAPYNKKKTK